MTYLCSRKGAKQTKERQMKKLDWLIIVDIAAYIRDKVNCITQEIFVRFAPLRELFL
jgi:hypothetical protein